MNELSKDQTIRNWIKRPIPDGADIVPQSTMVPWFGQINQAKACTISLNPSYKEFLDVKGEPRLCSRAELGIKDYEELNNQGISRVIEACNTYFENNPYSWFKHVDDFVQNFGYSYYDGTCVGLDLSPWATQTIWGDLDKAVQNKLLKIEQIGVDEKKTYLAYLLQNKKFKYIFLNGKTTVMAVKDIVGLSDFQSAEITYPTGQSTIKYYRANYGETRVVGFSGYLKYLTPEWVYEGYKKALEEWDK